MQRGIRSHPCRSTALILVGFLLLPAAMANAEEEKKKVQLRDLLPSTSRWFRGLSLDVSSIDQADRLFNGEDDEVGRPNPDSHLEQFELSLDLSKTIWSSEELVKAYSLAADKKTGKYVDADLFKHNYVDQRGRPLEFFARARKGDGLRRFAAAWKFSAGLSERETPAEPVEGDDDFEETYSATFDPKKLILGADDAVTAYKGVAAYTQLHKVPSGLPPCPTYVNPKTGLLACKPLAIGENPIKQLKQWSGLGVQSAAKAALIPAISYETIDQFDFRKLGGTLVRSPLVEEALDAWTATWSLNDALNTAAQRRAAITALSLHQKLVEEDFNLSQPLGIRGMNKLRLCSGAYVHQQLAPAYAFGDVKWTTPESNGGLFVGKGTSILAGVPDPAQTGPRCKPTPGLDCKVKLTVCLQDSADRWTGETWEFKNVRPCSAGTSGTAGAKVSSSPAACKPKDAA
jgi:hypothetical protein